jgi:hypothetical protein
MRVIKAGCMVKVNLLNSCANEKQKQQKNTGALCHWVEKKRNRQINAAYFSLF